MRAKAKGGAGGKSSVITADSSDEEEDAAPKKGTLDSWRAKPRVAMEAKSAARAGGGKKTVGGASAKVGKATAARPSAGKAKGKGKAAANSANSSDDSEPKKGKDDDLLSKLLAAKQQRELEEKEADRQITDRVEQFYDNGVRINPELRRMFAPGAGTS